MVYPTQSHSKTPGPASLKVFQTVIKTRRARDAGAERFGGFGFGCSSGWGITRQFGVLVRAPARLKCKSHCISRLRIYSWGNMNPKVPCTLSSWN